MDSCAAGAARLPDLPLRLAEYSCCYRYEQSGELLGPMRVRLLNMNDSHIYCRPEQFAQEFNAVSVSVHGQGSLGAKPKAEAAAEMLHAIRRRAAIGSHCFDGSRLSAVFVGNVPSARQNRTGLHQGLLNVHL